ncbi:hypothetical protein G3480_24525 [Thiorhodococcus mannitoliphagus]|uniref:RRM domain-containing protein n=1 Tax=Thiorhodococcus mannitoliphagus TaxID=329406 RepID=A0A6P1E247_9GAMM|nr:RNA-binding protein [Thiorhodococcus mannitoliphagus]NEX23421.1 hypothetical protein [Thiorhodococcus mannitoliphagus]
MISMPPTTKDQTSTIRVTHLPDGTSETEIERLFADYGSVHHVRLLAGDPSFRFQRVCYIDLPKEAVASAIAGLDGQLLNGSIIHLSQVAAGSATAEPQIQPATQTDAASSQSDGSLNRCTYELLSIEAADMPASTPGETWFRYVLASGKARIVGYRQGTLEEVTAFAEVCAEEFNVRNTIGWKATSSSKTQRRAPAAAKPAATGWN